MDETVSFIKNAEYLIHWKIGEYDEKRNGNIYPEERKDGGEIHSFDVLIH